MATNYNTMGFNPNLGQLPGFNPQTQGGFFNPAIGNQGQFSGQTGMQGMLPQVQNFNFRDDPGYQFRQDEGMRAIQQSAAARGTLGGGATLKGLARFGQDLASQEYGAAHQRHLQNLGAAEALQQGQFGREYGAAGMQEQLRQGHFGRQQQTAATQEALSQGQFGRELQTSAQQEALRQGRFGREVSTAGTQEALRQGQFTRGLGVENLQEQLRQGQFGRQFSLANLGMQGAQSMAGLVNPSIPGFGGPGGFGQIQAPTTQAQLNPQLWAQLMQGASGNLANIGAVMGQGQLGSGQAWQGAFGDISQMLGQQFGGTNAPTWASLFGG